MCPQAVVSYIFFLHIFIYLEGAVSVQWGYKHGMILFLQPPLLPMIGHISHSCFFLYLANPMVFWSSLVLKNLVQFTVKLQDHVHPRHPPSRPPPLPTVCFGSRCRGEGGYMVISSCLPHTPAPLNIAIGGLGTWSASEACSSTFYLCFRPGHSSDGSPANGLEEGKD